MSYGAPLKIIYNYCSSASVVRERNFHISVFRWLAVYDEEHTCGCIQYVEGHDFLETPRKVTLKKLTCWMFLFCFHVLPP